MGYLKKKICKRSSPHTVPDDNSEVVLLFSDWLSCFISLCHMLTRVWESRRPAVWRFVRGFRVMNHSARAVGERHTHLQTNVNSTAGGLQGNQRALEVAAWLCNTSKLEKKAEKQTCLFHNWPGVYNVLQDSQIPDQLCIWRFGKPRYITQ